MSLLTRWLIALQIMWVNTNHMTSSQSDRLKRVLTVVPMHIQYAMNIIIFVLLAIVMASVDQSYFGAPNCAKSVSR